MTTKKNNSNIKNKTKKNSKLYQKVSEQQTDVICKNYYNSYSTFEDKVEAEFKRQKIDFLSTNYDLEKEILKAHKTAVSLTNIQPTQDYYSYINERWIKDVDIEESQKYIIQIDDFRLVQDKVYKELIDIVKEYIENDKSERAKCIRNIYK